MAAPDLTVVARRRQTHFFAIASLLYVLLVPVKALVSFASARSLVDLPPVAWLVLAASAAPALLIVAALAWARRRGVRAAQPPLAWGLNWAERRRISKAIRANQPVREHPEVARDIARRTARSSSMAYLIALMGLALVAVRISVNSEDVSGFASYVAPFLPAVLAPFVWLEARRAQRWLDEHAQEEPT